MQEPATEIRYELAERPTETISGLLVAVVDYGRRIDFFGTLGVGLDLKMKSYVYTPQDKLNTLVASVVVGCRHVSEIQTKLVPDTAAAALFGLARFPDQAGINAFLRACGPAQIAHLHKAHATLLAQHSRITERAAWSVLPNGRRVVPLDLDQTPLVTRSTRATGTAQGHMGRKRGQVGYKKSVAFLGAGIQEVLWQQLDPANVHGQEALAPTLAALAALCRAKQVPPSAIVVRADSQYGSAAAVRRIQAAGHHYVLKGYTPRSAQAFADALPPDAVWTSLGTDTNGSTLWVVEAGEQELRGHDDPPDLPPVRTRVVLLVRVAWRTRRKHGRGAPGTVPTKEVRFEHYLTDFGPDVLSAAALIGFYNGREQEEGLFQSEQTAFGAHYLRTRDKTGEEAFLWVLASTINLLRWIQHTQFAQTPLEQAGLAKLVTQVRRIPATIVKQANVWLVLLPQTARLVRCLVNAWIAQTIQLPLPFAEAAYST